MKVHRGFSLLEVLVAFSILALSLGILMRIFSSGLHNADATRHQAQALVLAQSVLASAGVERPLSTGRSTGTFDGKFHWFLSARPMPPTGTSGTANPSQANSPELWEVNVRVAWRSGNGPERDLSLTSLRIQVPPKP